MRFGLVCLWTAIALTGCSGPQLVDAPLSGPEQQQAILDIVPIGTPRAEVETRLKEAGLQLHAGSGPSVAYCDVWNRESEKQRWYVNLMLLFDSQNKLYAVRSGQSETSVYRGGIPEQAATIAGQESSNAPPANSRATAPRTPFTGTP
ncbi:MAG TPA: hypothetical protein VHB77_03835 [Planctomycetaceae bacterium]|nr:hypothetical protein [Planctomycetaceae bacterium]